MKTLLLSATYLVGLGELFLAWYFWKTNSGNEIRKVMGLLAFSLGVWVILSAFSAYKYSDAYLVFVDKLILVFGILLLTCLLHLSLIFPYQVFKVDNYHRILLYLPVVIFSSIALSTNTITLGIDGSPTFAGRILAGPLYIHYNFYLLIIYFISLIIMLKRLPRLDGIHYKLTKLMIIAVAIGGAPAVLIDLVLPIVAPDEYPNFLYGNFFTSVWLGAVSFVVMKKNKS